MKKTNLFAAALLLPVLAGCQSGAPAPAADITDPPSDSSAETTDDRPQIPPDTDYEGYEFRVIARGVGKWTCTDMYAEDANGESLNDAVYARNQYVEETLNINISQQLVDNDSTMLSSVRASIMAGDDSFDLIWMGSQFITKLSLDGLLADMNSIPTLDLTNDWWDQKAYQNLKIGDRIYMTTGDISVMGNYATYVISFNKTLHSEHKLEDLYSLARDGKWTMDKFSELARLVSGDLDGNGKYDENDLYGFMTYGSDYPGFMLASGGSFAKIEGENITTNYNNERVITMLTKLSELKSENCSYHFPNDEVATKIFTEGRTLFSFRTLINLNFYRNMNTDYGILPMPKYDEEQAEYYCGVHAYGLSLIGMPVTNTDYERTGTILELMGWKSREVLTPAFYETTLKGKYFRDDESGEMLDIIFSSRVYDIGYYSNWGGLHTRLESMSSNKSDNFASVFASIESSVDEAVTETIDAYKNIK